VVSEIPARVVEVRVREGVRVQAGEPLLVLESMKMQVVVEAPRAGVVERVYVSPGRSVSPGEPLVRLV
jgi:pyruvate carboxylase subunit B